MLQIRSIKLLSIAVLVFTQSSSMETRVAKSLSSVVITGILLLTGI